MLFGLKVIQKRENAIVGLILLLRDCGDLGRLLFGDLSSRLLRGFSLGSGFFLGLFLGRGLGFRCLLCRRNFAILLCLGRSGLLGRIALEILQKIDEIVLGIDGLTDGDKCHRRANCNQIPQVHHIEHCSLILKYYTEILVTVQVLRGFSFLVQDAQP